MTIEVAENIPQPLTDEEEVIMEALEMLSEYIDKDDTTSDYRLTGKAGELLDRLQEKDEAYMEKQRKELDEVSL